MTVTFDKACLNTFDFDSQGCECGQTLDCSASNDHICIGDATLFTFIVDPPPPPPPCDPPKEDSSEYCYDTTSAEDIKEKCPDYDGTIPGAVLGTIEWFDFDGGPPDQYDFLEIDGTGIWFTYDHLTEVWTANISFPDRIISCTGGTPPICTPENIGLYFFPDCDYAEENCGPITWGFQGNGKSCISGIPVLITGFGSPVGPISTCNKEGQIIMENIFIQSQYNSHCTKTPGEANEANEAHYRIKLQLNPPADI